MENPNDHSFSEAERAAVYRTIFNRRDVRGQFLPDPIPDIALSSTQRHHLFLTVKEALHNVVKHAHASEVRIRLRASSERLEIEVEDNGQGIHTTTEGHGSGNMRSRIESIGGRLLRISEPSTGTIVSIVVPLTPQQPG